MSRHDRFPDGGVDDFEIFRRDPPAVGGTRRGTPGESERDACPPTGRERVIGDTSKAMVREEGRPWRHVDGRESATGRTSVDDRRAYHPPNVHVQDTVFEPNFTRAVNNEQRSRRPTRCRHDGFRFPCTSFWRRSC